MSLVIPNVFVGGAGNKAKASEVNGNFAAVAAKFTEGAGGIADGDVSTAAAIKGSKLSSVAGNRVTAAQLEDDAVDLRVLKDDASGGAPNAAVNTAAHIKDGIITNAKMVAATLKNGSIAKASVDVTIPSLAAGAAIAVDTTLTPSSALILGMHALVVGAAGPPGSLVQYELFLDTSGSKYYLYAVNINIGGPASSVLGVRVWYVAT